MSLSNSFAGGIFLAVALIHVIPEATESFEAA